MFYDGHKKPGLCTSSGEPNLEREQKSTPSNALSGRRRPPATCQIWEADVGVKLLTVSALSGNA